MYKVIYVDPPWIYRDTADAGDRGAGHKYTLMSIDDIKALPVANVADEDCACIMWATMPLLREGLDTIEAWGFEYKTAAFVWTKTRLGDHGQRCMWCGHTPATDAIGMGNWTRSNAEIALLGVRGRPERMSAGVRQIIHEAHPDVLAMVSCGICHVIHEPRGRHSAKPRAVRDRIVQLFGDVPRLELFARERAEGWDSWGLDLGVDVRDALQIGAG